MEGTSCSLALRGNDGAMKGWINAPVSLLLHPRLLAPLHIACLRISFRETGAAKAIDHRIVSSEAIPQNSLQAYVSTFVRDTLLCSEVVAHLPLIRPLPLLLTLL